MNKKIAPLRLVLTKEWYSVLGIEKPKPNTNCKPFIKRRSFITDKIECHLDIDYTIYNSISKKIKDFDIEIEERAGELLSNLAKYKERKAITTIDGIARIVSTIGLCVEIGITKEEAINHANYLALAAFAIKNGLLPQNKKTTPHCPNSRA